jgi:hypothetical protein
MDVEYNYDEVDKMEKKMEINIDGINNYRRN